MTEYSQLPWSTRPEFGMRSLQGLQQATEGAGKLFSERLGDPIAGLPGDKNLYNFIGTILLTPSTYLGC